MYLSYYGITSKHVIFTMSFWGGDYEYDPPVILGGVQVRPQGIQAPPRLPPNTVIGAYTTPPQGNALDYTQYEAIQAAPDDVKDFYDVFDWEDMFGAILCRNVLCYYLLPDEDPEEQYEYPYSWTDPYGYEHLIPSTFGSSGSSYSQWCMAYEYAEGGVIYLPFASFCLSLSNVLPDGWVDGRYLTLVGGGWYPVVPAMCFPPDSFAGFSEFCISTVPQYWDGEWNHGQGGNYYEHWQMTDLGQEDDEIVEVEGFSLTIHEKGTVSAFPFFGGAVLADEYVSVAFYGFPSYSPGPPRILPPPSGPLTPPIGGAGGKIFSYLMDKGCISFGIDTLLWQAFILNSVGVGLNSQSTELKGV